MNPGIKLMMNPMRARRDDEGRRHFDSTVPAAKFLRGLAQSTTSAIQALPGEGLQVGYTSAQNEPTLRRRDLPHVAWNAQRHDFFTRGTTCCGVPRRPALNTKVLALDWNWSRYTACSQEVKTHTVRKTLFGGVAWHGRDEGKARPSRPRAQPVPNIGIDTEPIRRH